MQDACYKLECQQQEQYKKHQQIIGDLFEQQKNQLQHQFNHLQQWLQQQQDAQNQQLKEIQKQLEFQSAECMARCLVKQAPQHSPAEHTGHDKRFVQLVQEVKDDFHELENTVLNKLQEEKCFMRDALSKAQSDILTLLSNIGEDISQVKEIIRISAFTEIEKQIELVRRLCEEVLLIQKQTHKDHCDEVSKENKQERFQHWTLFDEYEQSKLKKDKSCGNSKCSTVQHGLPQEGGKGGDYTSAVGQSQKETKKTKGTRFNFFNPHKSGEFDPPF